MTDTDKHNLRTFLTRLVFNWQQVNRIAFIAFFVAIELMIQLMVFSLLWFNPDYFGELVNMDVVGHIWLACAQMLLIFCWIIIYSYYQTKKTKHEYTSLQVFMLTLYLVYMGYLYLVLGVVNIFTGVTLVVSALIGLLLLHRRINWYAFVLHGLFIIGLLIAKIQGWQFHNLSDGLAINSQASFEGSVFWNILYLVLSIPKAIFGIIISLQLIQGVDDKLKVAEFNASYDGLTKVRNRRSMMLHIYQILFTQNHDCDCLGQDETQSEAFSVILLDIDFFKSINDTHGHYSGDLVLIEIAKRLSEMMIECCSEVSRYGGEEFLVILPQIQHHKAMAIAKRIHHHIRDEPYKIADNSYIEVTASLGVATLPHEDVMELQKQVHRSNRYNELDFQKNKKKDVFQSIETEKSIIAKLETQMADNDKVSIDSIKAYVKGGLEELAIENLINMADQALYDAKRMGRDCVVSAHQHVDEDDRLSNIELSQIRADEILLDLPIELSKKRSVKLRI